MHDGVTLEKAGVPSVTLIAPEFAKLAQSKKASLGLSAFEPVVVPFNAHLRIFGESPEEVRAAAEAVYEQIVRMLIWGPGRGAA